jgi:hypothetical protein
MEQEARAAQEAAAREVPLDEKQTQLDEKETQGS